MHYFLFSSGNILFSVLLGAIAMVTCGLYFEETFKFILNSAEQVKSWLLAMPMPTKYHNFVRLFLHESSFVFAFFTIATRVIVSALYGLLRSTLGLSRID